MNLSAEHRRWLELFLLSFAGLYLELLVIRWMSVDIRTFSVFKTFPLVVCFVGLGAGFAMGRDKYFRYLPLALLWFILWMRLPDFLNLSQWLIVPSFNVNVQWVDFGDFRGQAEYMAKFMVIIILLLSGPFAIMVAIGSRLGVLFNESKALVAYCINVGGSIAGSVIFSLLCFSGLAPWELLLPVLLLLLIYLPRKRTNSNLNVLVACLCLVLAAWNPDFDTSDDPTLAQSGNRTTYWSPYQRIDTYPYRVPSAKNGKPITVGLYIFSNKLLYQVAIDCSGKSYPSADLPETFKRNTLSFSRRYTLPFLLKDAKNANVLIVAAGSGNDVSEALQHGVASVDAVDIDPVILRLGKLYHPGHPYSDPRVSVTCDDARDFFNHCKKRYDLIVFSHLDSHIVTGQGASVRLDNYVYTKESFAKVMRLLKPDGLLVVSFFTCKPWLKDRLYLTMKEAIGYSPLVFQFDEHLRDDPGYVTNTSYVAGTPVKAGLVKLPESDAGVFVIAPMKNLAPVRKLTDDWPFLYVIPQAVDWPYMLVVAEILLIALLVGRKALFGKPADESSWQLFFMGAAFLLLELQSVSRLAQLYGSTWLTAAVVINGVLIMILLATLLVLGNAATFNKHITLLYSLLFVLLATSYFLPVNTVMEWCAEYGILGHFIVSVVTVLPMGAAALIFATCFSGAQLPGRLLAFNLFGSVIGAMLEYLSNYTGINALVALAAVLYLISYLCVLRAERKRSELVTA